MKRMVNKISGNTYIKSPLNYTGGKHKLLPQLIPLFPKQINRFIDLFAGGFNVGINIDCGKIIYNDKQKQVVEMLWHFKTTPIDKMLKFIDTLINEYSLSKGNKEGYILLRKRYNSFLTEDDRDRPLMLYTLICFAFSNQIRFNSKSEFNMPFGERTFNLALREKFCMFVKKMHKEDVEFSSCDFRNLGSKLDLNDFVYCDPPYFNSTATYNENGGWGEQDETDLLTMLDLVNSKGIKFALSNNLAVNPNLKEWAKGNGYAIHYLECSYSNCNYQRKNKPSKDVEVLITNYI